MLPAVLKNPAYIPRKGELVQIDQVGLICTERLDSEEYYTQYRVKEVCQRLTEIEESSGNAIMKVLVFLTPVDEPDFLIE